MVGSKTMEMRAIGRQKLRKTIIEIGLISNKSRNLIFYIYLKYPHRYCDIVESTILDNVWTSVWNGINSALIFLKSYWISSYKYSSVNSTEKVAIELRLPAVFYWGTQSYKATVLPGRFLKVNRVDKFDSILSDVLENFDDTLNGQLFNWNWNVIAWFLNPRNSFEVLVFIFKTPNRTLLAVFCKVYGRTSSDIIGIKGLNHEHFKYMLL